MTMIGFPPAIADRWSLSNWQKPRSTAGRSSTCGRSCRPPGSGGAPRAPGRSWPAPGFDEQQIVWRLDGSSGTVAEVLADTYTDGFLVMHDGRVVAEQYPFGMSAERTHMLMSVSKSVVGCVVGILADQRGHRPHRCGRLLHSRTRRVRLPRRDGA